MGVRRLKRTHSGISTRLPTSKEAVALRQPPVEPILVWESLKRDENDASVDFGIALIAGKRVQLVFDLG